MAAGDVKFGTGTAITLRDTGTPSSTLYVWGVKGLAAGAAIVSPPIDLGAGFKDVQFSVQLRNQWAAAPTINLAAAWYYGEWGNDSGPASPDGELPSVATVYASGSAGASKWKNLTLLGRVTAETSAVGPFRRTVRPVFLRRWVSFFLLNEANQALVNTDDLNTALITPVYPQIQAS